MTSPTSQISRYIIKSIEAKELKKRSMAIRLADNLTTFFGSIPFLVINALFFSSWVLLNTGLIPLIKAFDPFPFPMLTTIVSLEAIILTVIVLMSQNRQSLISSLREEMDIQINLIAEREITKILKLLNELLREKGIKIEDKELDDMLRAVDESYIERKLEQELTTKQSGIIEKVIEPIRIVEEGVEKVTQPIKKAAEDVERTINPKL